MSRFAEAQSTPLTEKVRQLEAQLLELKAGRQFSSQSSGVKYYSEKNNGSIAVVINGGPKQYGTKVTVSGRSATWGIPFSVISTFSPAIHRPALAYFTNILGLSMASDSLIARLGIDSLITGANSSISLISYSFDKLLRPSDILDDRNIVRFGSESGAGLGYAGWIDKDTSNTSAVELSLSTIVRASDRGSIETVLYLHTSLSGITVS